MLEHSFQSSSRFSTAPPQGVLAGPFYIQSRHLESNRKMATKKKRWMNPPTKRERKRKEKRVQLHLSLVWDHDPDIFISRHMSGTILFFFLLFLSRVRHSGCYSTSSFFFRLLLSNNVFLFFFFFSPVTSIRTITTACGHQTITNVSRHFSQLKDRLSLKSCLGRIKTNAGMS